MGQEPTLAVYCFGYNLEKIRYPYLASLRSALSLVGDNGRVFYCQCLPTGDDSLERIKSEFEAEINGGYLDISYHPWGDHHTIQAHIANYLLDRIGTDFDFALKLDMDEVLCEWSFEGFWEVLQSKVVSLAIAPILLRPHYRHFCPDDRHTFPFIYSSKAVVSRTRDGLRYATSQGGDACALGGGSEVQTELIVHHYGKMGMGREAEALGKELTFTELYRDLGFPDPKVVAQQEQGYLDYYKVFDGALERGEFREYDGPHPIFVFPWLAEQRRRAAEFQARHP